MVRIYALLVLLLTSVCGFGQELEVGTTYELAGPVTVRTWSQDGCGSDAVRICANNKFTVQGNDNGVVRFKMITRYIQPEICDRTGNTYDLYCLEEKTLRPLIKTPRVLPTVGVLAVPFKFQFKDYQIFSSGTLGGFVGGQTRLNWDPAGQPSTFFIVGSAGYSRIPLNNVNAVNPENVDDVGALSYGIATGISLGQFQVIVIKGWDSYNVNDDKQTRSWLSLGLGFGFLKPPTQ